jgi:hypothetical protein
VLIAVERHGPVRSVPVANDSTGELSPKIAQWVAPEAQLMTDQHHAYRKIAKSYAGHDWVHHGHKQYARGDVNSNTAESFGAILERAKQGVFHYLSKAHMNRYIHEAEFRWNQREPIEKTKRNGTRKIVMVSLPVMTRLRSLLSHAPGQWLRRSLNGGIYSPVNTGGQPSFGL